MIIVTALCLVHLESVFRWRLGATKILLGLGFSHYANF